MRRALQWSRKEMMMTGTMVETEEVVRDGKIHGYLNMDSTRFPDRLD